MYPLLKVNKTTWKDHFPLPFFDKVLERLSKHSFFHYLDGNSGYHQIHIHPDDQSKTTFTSPYGTFTYLPVNVVGLCNAPALLQMCKMATFSDWIESIMEGFIYDFSVYGKNFKEYLENSSNVLKSCQKNTLILIGRSVTLWSEKRLSSDNKCHEALVFFHPSYNLPIGNFLSRPRVMQMITPPA